MRGLFFVLLSTIFIQTGLAQGSADHKIVFQLTSNDTLAHKALMKQLGNILTLSPTTKLEVVCHGPGLSMLVNQTSIVTEKISEFSEKGVDFMACQFSMKERKVAKEELHSNAKIVPGGILEIVQKQEQGWSYIKAGN
jgi:intracellular sulfur oxidation DsrE/DsrF family protein